jgi:hypothetical protein
VGRLEPPLLATLFPLSFICVLIVMFLYMYKLTINTIKYPLIFASNVMGGERM